MPSDYAFTSLLSQLFGNPNGSIRQTHPAIHADLERFQRRVPRYLFRGWHSRSGGSQKNNATHLIKPAGFNIGSGLASVYDMSFQTFTNMVKVHLDFSSTIPTEFSSWAACLNTAMRFCEPPYCTEPESAFISVMDTKNVGDHIEIFYVPQLASVPSLGVTPYGGEFLAHGVIQGDFVCALSYRHFKDLKVFFNPTPERLLRHDPVTEEIIAKCRRIGRQYGNVFFLPVALAVLAKLQAETADSHDLLQKDREASLVENGFADLEPPDQWETDERIVNTNLANREWREVKMFHALLEQAASRGRISSGEVAQQQQAAKSQAQHQRASDQHMRVRSDSRQERLHKQLNIEMHRNRLRDHFGYSESEVRRKEKNGEWTWVQRKERGEITMKQYEDGLAELRHQKAEEEDTEMGGMN